MQGIQACDAKSPSGTHLSSAEINHNNVPQSVQVRLLSQNKHELLRRVPDGLADVFRIGSTAPGQHPPLPQTVIGACDMLVSRAVTVLSSIAVSPWDF